MDKLIRKRVYVEIVNGQSKAKSQGSATSERQPLPSQSANAER